MLDAQSLERTKGDIFRIAQNGLTVRR